jgi:MFS family permease
MNALDSRSHAPEAPYDANIFASVYDVIPAEARGSAAGMMNTVGWLGGGAVAPLAIGILAQVYGLGVAIALASVVYLLAGGFLVTAIALFVKRDVETI